MWEKLVISVINRLIVCLMFWNSVFCFFFFFTIDNDVYRLSESLVVFQLIKVSFYDTNTNLSLFYPIRYMNDCFLNFC